MRWGAKTAAEPASLKRDDDTASSARPSAHRLSTHGEKQNATPDFMPLSGGDSLGLQPETKSAQQETPEYPVGATLFFILLALGLSIFLASLDMTIVATAIPRITDDFKGLDQVSWYGAAFFLTSGGFQSSWGKAYKYLPLKATFLAAVFVFELGSLLCAVAPGSTALIVGRAVNGLGAAGIGTGAYTILAFVAAPPKRALFTGVIGVANGVACVAGPLVGGIFADKVSWRWCFYVNLPFGGLAAAIIILGFRTPKGARPVSATWKEILLQMDLVGAFILVGAIVSYILALQYGGQTRSWRDGAVIGLLVAFVGLVLVFCFWERHLQERAMVVPRLMSKRSVRVGTLFVFFFGGSYFLTIYYLPIFFQSVDEASPIMSGVMNLPLILSVTVSMVLSGALVGVTGRGSLIEICGAAVGLIGAGLVLTLDVGSGPGRWVTYQIVGGIGWGFAFQVPMIIAQGKAAADDLSSTTSLILLFQCLGGTVFVSAAQSAFVNVVLKSLPARAPGVDPAAVIRTGATEIRSAFPAQQVPGIVASYMAGLKAAFSIALAACVVALAVSVCNERSMAGKGPRVKDADDAVTKATHRSSV